MSLHKIIPGSVTSMILLAAVVVASMSAADAQSQQAVIQSSSSFVNSLGWMQIVGEVKNNSPDSIEFVRITATFYDADNKVLDTDTGFSQISILRPEEKSGFTIMLADEDQASKVASYKLAVESDRTSEVMPAKLALREGNAFYDSLGFYHIVGEIENTADSETEFVRVAGTFYDSGGIVIAVDSTFSRPATLAAGQTAPFEMIIGSNADKIQSFELNVQSEDFAMINEEPEEQDSERTIKTGIESTQLKEILTGNLDGTDNLIVGADIGFIVRFENNNLTVQPYVMVISIRTADGVTVGLRIADGTLMPDGAVEELSRWHAEEPGLYEIRTFLLSSLDEPEIISRVYTGTFEVSAA